MFVEPLLLLRSRSHPLCRSRRPRSSRLLHHRYLLTKTCGSPCTRLYSRDCGSSPFFGRPFTSSLPSRWHTACSTCFDPPIATARCRSSGFVVGVSGTRFEPGTFATPGTRGRPGVTLTGAERRTYSSFIRACMGLPPLSALLCMENRSLPYHGWLLWLPLLVSFSRSLSYATCSRRVGASLNRTRPSRIQSITIPAWSGHLLIGMRRRETWKHS